MKQSCCNFSYYLSMCNSIYDIMVAAYKVLIPFEPGVTMGKDIELTKIVSGFAEQNDEQLAFRIIKSDLQMWLIKQEEIEIYQFRKKLFWLIFLIDAKCAGFFYSSLPESYDQRRALNDLFEEEIVVFPRFKSEPMEILSEKIGCKDTNGGFYGRCYARTADISGYIYNYIIFCPKSKIRPVLNIPSYHKEIGQKIKANHYKLKIGIFPLLNVNINQIFTIEKEIEEENRNGLFRVLSQTMLHGQEEWVLERCKDTFTICRKQHVDLAVFPEMIFNRRMQEEIKDYIKDFRQKEDSFPLFTWLGTAWENKKNQCMVIDQYGKVVFEQRKYVPYEFRIETKESLSNEGYNDLKKKSRIVLREDLEAQKEWQVHFLDIPGFFRIATAICRDISDDYLGALLKELYCDMIIVPAFSSSDLLTGSKINSLVIDHVISIVCNACSALCKDKQDKLVIHKEHIGTMMPFCYVCIPAKALTCNTPDYHPVIFKEQCQYTNCEQRCAGHLFSISFAECVEKNHYYGAKVIYE